MVYSSTPSVTAQVPGIASSLDAARSFVSRLSMQTVSDLLALQCRNAHLPDAIISAILNQLMVQITYAPLECKVASVDKPADMIMGVVDMQPHCIIVGNTVTALCIEMSVMPRMPCVDIYPNFVNVRYVEMLPEIFPFPCFSAELGDGNGWYIMDCDIRGAGIHALQYVLKV
ncbi:hypothetical protein KIN20_003819 [Parelaphostrongylus tenuis]|uniref:Uncharacterized protein n=1 Tax=Parelaphostrongylus tenuis TaxID=148309 RepID=A0AAD5QGF2_PARTN|nr:hypothetical protein KIN20_003819 [Parelaphostrongylus tenuis]